jgi:hypothetical protein
MFGGRFVVNFAIVCLFKNTLSIVLCWVNKIEHGAVSHP